MMVNNIARGLITIATLWYGFVPLMADLNSSHLLNPNWTPHARMHLTWLLSTNSLVSLYALFLLWREKETIKAGLLGLCVVLGFWTATITRDLYGGMLVDPDLAHEFVLGVNPNIAANIMVLCLLTAGITLQKRTDKQPER